MGMFEPNADATTEAHEAMRNDIDKDVSYNSINDQENADLQEEVPKI